MRTAPSKSARVTAILAALIAAVAGLAPEASAQKVEAGPFYVGYGASRTGVAGGADGNVAIAWDEYDNKPVDRIGWTRVFTPAGTPLSAAIRVDVGGRFELPQIGALPGGGYVVGSAYHNGNTNHGVLGRFLDAGGAPTSAPFEVHDVSNGLGSLFAMTVASTGPVFAWHRDDLFARRVGFLGQLLGGPVVVEPDGTTNSGMSPHAAAIPGGGYAIAWFHPSQETRLRVVGANGVPLGGPTVIDDLFTGGVAASDSMIAVAGSRAGAVWVHRFDAAGTSLGAPTLLYDVGSSLTGRAGLEFDGDGNLLVVWSGFVGSLGQWMPVRMQVVDAAGNLTRPAVVLDPHGAQFLDVTRLANGYFAASWNRTYGAVWGAVASVCDVVLASCGDGVIDPPCEQCDDGAANSDTEPDACRINCRPASCGDGTTDSGEQCDDGNVAGGDGCSQTCILEICGNGSLEGGEVCDDGDLEDGDGCDSNCRPTGCGNGVITAGEECEDGNVMDGDGCDSSCLVEECGNQRVEGGEQCDDGDLEDGDGCDSNCTTTRCGNGILTAGEECDDGGNVSGDGCDQLCRIEDCGNGRVEGNEQCDDGNGEDGDGCESDCAFTTRVDALVEPVRPLRLVLPAGATSKAKTLAVTVRNVDAGALEILQLSASDGTCPPGTVAGTPDFDAGIAGAQDSVALLPRQRKRARIPLVVQSGTFAAADRRVPFRCRLELVATPLGGVVDENPSNGRFSVSVDLYDRGAGFAPGLEVYTRALKPLRLRIPNGLIAVERSVRVRARATSPDSPVSFEVSAGDCPPGTAVLGAEQASGVAVVTVRASRAFFTTENHLSPQRCTAVIAALTGGDADPSNDTVRLSIDVVDDND